MGIQKCGLNIDRVYKELQPHGTLDFPCGAYAEKYSDKPEQAIPWHWHEELEITYVKNGKIKLQIPSKTYFLEKGDCFVINSNILHCAIAEPQCELQSLVFHSTLITGSNGAVFATKYLLPLISQTTFDGYLLKKDTTGGETDCFINAFEALAQDAPGFEFTVRENLSRICYFLYLKFEREISVKEMGMNQDNLRIRKMLDFIHSRFTDAIVLSDIAKAADIGERECLRCFQRTIQLSPIQYLLKYRVMQGADMLLKDPSVSVSEIAALCGFDSPSNFSKIFKRFYNNSPREYRKEYGKLKQVKDLQMLSEGIYCK